MSEKPDSCDCCQFETVDLKKYSEPAQPDQWYCQLFLQEALNRRTDMQEAAAEFERRKKLYAEACARLVPHRGSLAQVA